MTKNERIRLMLKRTAELAVGASTLRGRPSGTIKKARNFLKRLKPQQFVVRDEERFRAQLDYCTKELGKRLNGDWGAARKVLNIFLRDIFYHHYLRGFYNFNCIENWLETPLDRIAAKRILEYPEGKNLPRWNGINKLKSAPSKEYQDAVRKIAAKKRIAAVHLDLILWGRD
jgi:hypothetical protein